MRTFITIISIILVLIMGFSCRNDDSKTCDQILQEIDNEVALQGTCQIDNDCELISVLCYWEAVNKMADLQRLRQLETDFKNMGCQAFCPANVPTKTFCENGQCKYGY